MYSKTGFLLAFLLAVSLGCDFKPFQNAKIGEGGPQDPSVQLDLGKYSCMTDIGRKVDEYIDGKMNEQQIHLFMDCIRTALSRFEFYARGKSADYYEPLELSAFLNREFLRDKKLHPELVQEIMEVKTVLIGGSVDRITRQEFKEIGGLLNFVEDQALKNLKFLKLHRGSNQTDAAVATVADLEAAKLQMKMSAAEFSERLNQYKKPYKLSSFQRLLTEVRRFLDWNSRNQEGWSEDQTVRLFSVFKSIVTGADGDVIGSASWAPISQVVVTLYGIHLDYDLFLKRVPITYGEGLDVLIGSFNSLFQALQVAVNNNRDGVVEFQKTDQLIGILEELKLLPLNIRGKSLIDSYNYLIQHAFQNHVETVRAVEIRGLNQRAINEIRSEFFLWADAQQFLSENAEKYFTSKTGSPFFAQSKGFDRAIKSFDFTEVLNWSKDPRAQEISFLVENIRPLFKDGDERVTVVAKNDIAKNEVRHGIHDLTRLNLIRALVRVLIRGFAAKDRVATMAGLTEDEMERFYQIARPLGEDLLFMDPRRAEVGRRIYSEANLFTFSGNGVREPDARNQHLMSFIEITEVLALLWSGGQVRDQFYNNILTKCREVGIPDGPLDIVKKAKIDRQCFRQFLADQKFTEFDNLPSMRDYLMDLKLKSKTRYLEYLSAVERISLVPCEKDSDRFIEIGELATFATATHYMEVIFTQYDRDKNGRLSGAEAMAAFPRLNGFLARNIEAKTGNKPQVDTVKAVYAYMLQHQELPTGWDLIGVGWDAIRFSDDPNKAQTLNDVSLDRLGLTRVLRALAEASPPKMHDPKCQATLK